MESTTNDRLQKNENFGESNMEGNFNVNSQNELIENDINKNECELNTINHIQNDSKEYMVSSYNSECEDYSQINKIIPLRKTTGKLVLFIILNIFTVGIINLFIAWFPKLKLYLIYSVCLLSEASHLGIVGKDDKIYDQEKEKIVFPDVENINDEKSVIKAFNLNLNKDGAAKEIIKFTYRLFDYVFNENKNCFEGLSYRIKETQEKFHEIFMKGLKSEEIEYQGKIFGICDIDIKINSIWKVLFDEITDPFYLFQVYSIILWYCTEYYYYASVIVILTIISLIVCVYETHKNLKQIQEMARYSCDVNVFRSSSSFPIRLSSTNLVPGDLFEIPEDGLALPCDCILVSGSAIVNESMLTGESTPVVKAAMPPVAVGFDTAEQDSEKFVLFGGTKVVQRRAQKGGKVMAVVYQTGFKTVKGNLIRQILFPREQDEEFTRDSVKYILFMCIVCVVGFSISAYFLKHNGECSDLEIFKRFLDIITTAVPPSLPTCLSVGVTYSLGRLKDKNIFCIHRDKVNVAGSVNMIVFDKTGTLTEDHLDISGYLPSNLNTSQKPAWDPFTPKSNQMAEQVLRHFKAKINDPEYHNARLDTRQLFVECLAACHCLTAVHGKNVGDPIDLKMFEELGWIMRENVELEGESPSANNGEQVDPLVQAYIRPPSEPEMVVSLQAENVEESLKLRYELGIVRRFDFSSKLQRMTTITKNLNENYFKAFCKGSPEKIIGLCKKETIPEDFDKVLEKYTAKGFRVLGMAAKMIKMDFIQSQKVSRDAIEKNMIFLGLLIVKNKLKSVTQSTVSQLDEADLRMVMATGDNILTGISVAKECNLILGRQLVFSCELENGSLVWKQIEAEAEKEFTEDELFLKRRENDATNNEANEVNKENEGNLVGNLVLKDNDGNKRNKENNILNSTTENPRFRESLQKFHPIDIISASNIKVASKEEADDSDKKNEKNDKTKKRQSLISLHSLLNQDFNLDKLGKSPKEICGSEYYCIAIQGDIFEKLYNINKNYIKTKDPRLYKAHSVFRQVLKSGRVFARMSPENKAQLVQSFKDEGCTTLMCGDGANDCAALRQANVGVSLSAEEASIAAHFTSKVPDISCLFFLLREGKCSLTTCIQTFKYMMLYSLIQFIAVTLLMIYLTYLSDFQFLVSDLFIIFPLAWFISMTAPYEKLTYHYPISNILSFPIITSIAVQAVFVFVFDMVGYKILKNHYNWDNMCEFDDNDNPLKCHENTIFFLISHYQYLTCALAFSVSKPFREPIYKNWLLMLYLVAIYFYSIWFTINCDDWSKKLLLIFDFEEDEWYADTDDEEERRRLSFKGRSLFRHVRLLFKASKILMKDLFRKLDDDEDGGNNENESEEEDEIIPTPSDANMIKYYILIIVMVNLVVSVLLEWLLMALIRGIWEKHNIKKYNEEIEIEKKKLAEDPDSLLDKEDEVSIYKLQRIYYYNRRKDRERNIENDANNNNINNINTEVKAEIEKENNIKLASDKMKDISDNKTNLISPKNEANEETKNVDIK